MYTDVLWLSVVGCCLSCLHIVCDTINVFEITIQSMRIHYYLEKGLLYPFLSLRVESLGPSMMITLFVPTRNSDTDKREGPDVIYPSSYWNLINCSLFDFYRPLFVIFIHSNFKGGLLRSITFSIIELKLFSTKELTILSISY